MERLTIDEFIKKCEYGLRFTGEEYNELADLSSCRQKMARQHIENVFI